MINVDVDVDVCIVAIEYLYLCAFSLRPEHNTLDVDKVNKRQYMKK